MTVLRAALTAVGLLATALPAPAQSSLATLVPSPVDHPVASPTAPRTSHAWRNQSGGWGETFVDETLRMRGYNDVREIKGPGDQGIDRLALKYSPAGNLRDAKFVEVKTHRGTRARLSSTRRGRQLSRAWLTEKYRLMRRSGDPRLRQLASEINQLRRQRGLRLESLGELHDVNTRTGRYTRREPLSGRELSSDSIDRFLRRIQRGPVSPPSKRWAALSLAHYDQIRSMDESLWTGRAGAARSQVLNHTASAGSARALRPAASKSLSRLARVAGPLGVAAAFAFDARELYAHASAYRRGEIGWRAMVMTATRTGSGVAGAVAGAKVGTWIGAYGGSAAWITVPGGALVGAAAGYCAASSAAGAVTDAWYSRVDEETKQTTDAWLVKTPYHQLNSTPDAVHRQGR